MRRLVGRLLGGVGLAPLSQLRALQQRLDKVMQRSAALDEERNALKRQLKVAGGEAARQAARITTLTNRAERSEQEHKTLRTQLGEVRGRADRDAKHAKKVEEQSRAVKQLTQELRARYDRAVKALGSAQQRLIVTETKLDIVEGAITVLDRRTRHVTAAAALSEQTQG